MTAARAGQLRIGDFVRFDGQLHEIAGMDGAAVVLLAESGRRLDGRYDWVPFCEKQFGDIPSQICFEWNTARHTTDDAVPTRRRAFTKAELQHFFDVVDDFIDEQHRPAPGVG